MTLPGLPGSRRPSCTRSGGGKSGLLLALIREGVDSTEAQQVMADLQPENGPAQLWTYLTQATRSMCETWSPLMRQVIAAAPQDAAVRQALTLAHGGMREGMTLTAHRLQELGGLREGLSVQQAADAFWYYLGSTSYFTLTDELNCSVPQSAEWLHAQLAREVLQP